MLEVVPKAELTLAKEELSVEERLVAATKAKEEGNAKFKAAHMMWGAVSERWAATKMPSACIWMPSTSWATMSAS